MYTQRPDFRTREMREKEVLANVEIDNAKMAWVDAIPQRRAAALRLVNRGVIRLREDRYGARFELVKHPNANMMHLMVQRLRAWWEK